MFRPRAFGMAILAAAMVAATSACSTGNVTPVAPESVSNSSTVHHMLVISKCPTGEYYTNGSCCPLGEIGDGTGGCTEDTSGGGTGSGGTGPGPKPTPSALPTPVIGYTGLPQQGQHCDGSQYEIGSAVIPTDNSAGATYYVNDISTVWQNGVPYGFVYRATTPAAPNTQYYFMQITNNATPQWTATIGINFGPVTIGVSGGQGFNSVSPIEWFTPGQNKLPSGSTAGSCWPKAPMTLA